MVSGVSSSSGAGRPVVQPVNPQPSNPKPPHSSGVSSAGDSTWNGRKLRLVLEDNFSGSGVDTSKWEHEVSLWGGGVSMILLFLIFCLCSSMPSFVTIFC